MTNQPAQRTGGPVHPAGGHMFIWGIVGVLAMVIFNAGWLIAETWQGPSYSPIADTISDMQAQTAPHVWFPIACFALGALGGFGFALFGLRPALAGAGKVAANAPWLLAFSLLALGNSFPLIPVDWPTPAAPPVRSWRVRRSDGRDRRRPRVLRPCLPPVPAVASTRASARVAAAQASHVRGPRHLPGRLDPAGLLIESARDASRWSDRAGPGCRLFAVGGRSRRNLDDRVRHSRATIRS